MSPDATLFIDKIKSIISKRVFANVKSPFLSRNTGDRQVQISFVTNGCVDIMVDYFRGKIDMPFSVRTYIRYFTHQLELFRYVFVSVDIIHNVSSIFA